MFTTIKQAVAFFDDRKKLGIKPGLERINQLLTLLDNPQNKIKAIHVAGTNGKGSTIAFLKSALVANGYKVGVFTSPSIDGLTGHIHCNHEKITDEIFIALLNNMYPAIITLDERDNHPTEFEIITALAFDYFSIYSDIALIETGMGGREDTTNCFQPILSIITNIDKDHTGFLGNTIKDIAYQKAGIIKENVPVIVGEVNEAAFSVLSREIAAKNAALYRIGKQFTYDGLNESRTKQSFIWKENSTYQTEVAINMLGEHQVKNCSLAIMSLFLLEKQGYSIHCDLARKGITDTFVPGRFEVISTNPTVILDGAHNPAGIRSFLKTVSTHYDKVDKHLIFAAFEDKDIQEMLHLLAEEFSSITLTSFAHPRAASASYLSNYTRVKDKHVNNEWIHAMKEMDKGILASNKYYFITGSLYFIANVRKYFDNRSEL